MYWPKIRRVAAEPDDLLHVVLLHLGRGPERVRLRRRRVKLRRVMVAHGLVGIERLGAKLAERDHPPRRPGLAEAPRLRGGLPVPAGVRMAVVDHVGPHVGRQTERFRAVGEPAADRLEDPLGIDRQRGAGGSARYRSGARCRRSKAPRPGCCSRCGPARCRCGCAGRGGCPCRCCRL